MNKSKSTMAQQIAQAAVAFEPRAAAGDLAGACGHGENLIVLVPDSPRLPGNGPGSDQTLIAESDRGEDAAKKHFEQALQHDLPADVAAVVRRQFAGVREAHDRIRALERAAK